MLWKTHLAFALLIGLFLFPFFRISLWLFFPLLLFGALLPDIDSPKSRISKSIGIFSKIINFIFKHRGIFHSFIFLAGLYIAVAYLFGKWYGLAIGLGYISHLIIDGFTVLGVNYLHPIAKLHLSGFIETGTIAETMLFILLAALNIIKLYGLLI